MPKRFTATEKWTDPWFCSLSDNNKLFWIYLLDNCDCAGIWRVNFPMFEFYVKNFVYNPEIFKHRITVLDDEKWFIDKFIEFQYGKLRSTSLPHLSVIKILEKYKKHKCIADIIPSPFPTLAQGLPKGSPTLKEKEKDKAKEEEKESIRSRSDKVLEISEKFHGLFYKLGKCPKCHKKIKSSLDVCGCSGYRKAKEKFYIEAGI